MRAGFKMIATDLDGTLLRRDKTIGGYTAEVFRRCARAGMRIAIATARPIRAVDGWLELGFDPDAIAYHNGAAIRIGGEIVQRRGIEPDAARALIEGVARIGGIGIGVEAGDALYASFDASAIWRDAEFIESDFNDLPDMPADKLVFIPRGGGDIEAIGRLLREGLYMDLSEGVALMVMNREARKRNAIRCIAEYYNINMSDVAAFGDDYNDVEMLRDSGIGIATANAIAEAKAAAGFVCGDCDGDGVARWIEENLL